MPEVWQLEALARGIGVQHEQSSGLCRSDKRKTQSDPDFEIDVGDGETGVEGSALAQRVGAEQNSCYGRMVTAHNRAKSIGRDEQPHPWP